MDFSVVIPCHNAELYISEALDSVAKQTVAPREVIIIDDMCTDNSIAIVKRHPLETKIISINGGNASIARNIGVRQSESQWVAFLDADDLWFENHLERAAALLEGSDDVGFFNSPDGLRLDGTTFERKPLHPADGPMNGVGIETYLEWQFGIGFPGTSACVVNRDVLIDIRGFDESQIRRHDIELWLRLLQHGTFAYDPVASSAYRIGVPGSVSRKVAEAAFFHLRAFILHREALAGPMMSETLQFYSRRAMAAAYTDGSTYDRQRARKLAWSYLSTKDRYIFGFFAWCPWLFGLMNRQRRKGLTHARDEK